MKIIVLTTQIVGIPMLLRCLRPQTLVTAAFAPSSSKRQLTNVPIRSTTTTTTRFMTSSSNERQQRPIAILVEAEIKPDRIDEFLNVMERDAIGSRAEPGCLRFDVIRSQDEPNKFFFYEVYVDAEAVNFHKTQDHFALWTNFKNDGGVVHSMTHKSFGVFMSS